MVNQQVRALQQELYHLLESNAQSLAKYEQFETVLREKEDLLERIHNLEDEVEDK